MSVGVEGAKVGKEKVWQGGQGLEEVRAFDGTSIGFKGAEWKMQGDRRKEEQREYGKEGVLENQFGEI